MDPWSSVYGRDTNPAAPADFPTGKPHHDAAFGFRIGRIEAAETEPLEEGDEGIVEVNGIFPNAWYEDCHAGVMKSRQGGGGYGSGGRGRCAPRGQG